MSDGRFSPPRRVLLIGWEGADWRIAEPLVEAGQVPHLKGLTDRGTMGNLYSLAPMVCPILWTSIATGVHGHLHKILGHIEPDGCGDVRPVQSTSRGRKAIWNILSQHGRRAAVVGWPATHPAEPINGVVVSDRFPNTSGAAAQLWPADERTVHPEALFDDVMGLRVDTGGLTPGQIAAFVPGLDERTAREDRRVAAIAAQLAQAASIQQAATWTMQNVEWDFLAVHYSMLGALSHEFMRYTRPDDDRVDERDRGRYGQVVDTAYRLHDKMLGRLLELAGPDTLVLLVSDHGFRRTPVRLASKAAEHRLASIPSEPRYRYLRYHRRDGILCAAGPGVKSDELVFDAEILDIAPTILAALGVPVPDDMDGKVLTSLFETPPDPVSVASHEPRAEGDGLHPDLHGEPWTEQDIIDNVAALGLASLEPEAASALEVCAEQRELNLAEIYVSLRRYQDALEIYRHVFERDDSFPIRVPIIRCLIMLGRYDEAEAALERATSMLPFSAVPNLLWATLHAARGDLDAAESCLQQVEETPVPDAEILMQLGGLALRLQRWDKALGFFKRALAGDPLAAKAHDGIGRALLRLGRVEESLAHHRESVRLVFRRSVAHEHLGEALLEAGELRRAVRAFETAVELDPANERAAKWLAHARRSQEREWLRDIDALKEPPGREPS